jgi:hypothetical protein
VNNPWVWIVVLLVALWVAREVLERYLDWRGPDGRGDVPLPYRRKDYLLSVAERSLYEVLRQALGGGDDAPLVFAKVRLLDLLWLPRGTPNPQAHRNRVISKHVDFVVCDRAQLRPLLVIELDDATHEAEDRRERDAFVDRALAAAGLPVLHVTARRAYATRELAERVRAAIAGGEGRATQ